MVEILQSKNSATRFQILVEIASGGPDIQQRRIAIKLGITPQAISEYIRQLIREELVISTGRSRYRVSAKGVNWMLKGMRELRGYLPVVEQAVTNITVCAAVAECDVKKGQAVGLKMKDGLLYASPQADSQARGVAESSVREGEDLDVSNIEGLVDFARGRVTILQVPVVQKGGSRQVDLKLLRAYAGNHQQLGAIGIEALIALRRVEIEPRYLYGVVEAAVEAARCGLSFVVVCTEDAVSGLIKRLQDEGMTYELMHVGVKGG